MHSFPFIPSSSPIKQQPIDMPKPAETPIPRETSSEVKPFSEHLAARIEESSSTRADRAERKNEKNSDFRNAEENKDKEETNRSGKEPTAEKNPLHHLAGAVNLRALKISKEAKEKSPDELSVKKAADLSNPPKKQKVSLQSDVAQIEQGIASILAALTAHRTAKPDTAKAAQQEDVLPRQTKDLLLQKSAHIRKQLSAIEQNPSAAPEERNAAKRADNFLVKLEQMIKKNSPKEFRKEHLTAISDDIRRELTVIRQAADKHAKPRVTADAAAAATAVRIEPQKQETADANSAAAKESGSSVQQMQSASSSKSDSDTQGGLGFMKHANTMKDSQTAGKETVAQQIKGTPFAEHVDEIISKSKTTIRDGQNGSMSFRLNPDNLGGVNVSLGLENGVLSAKFLVDSPEAKESLAAGMNALKETLAQEGIQLGAFQVDVRAGYSGQSRDSEENAAPVRKSAASEAEKVTREYDASSVSVHNGAIDIVI